MTWNRLCAPKNMTREFPLRPRQVESKQLCVTELVQICVADVLGVGDAEDAAKVVTVVRFKTDHFKVYETLCSTVVEKNR